jgi:carbon-monoxide dehydrogenase medium subunit
VILILEAGRIATASITLGGVGATPLRLAAAEATLRGQTPTPDLFAQAAATAATIDAMEDAQIPAWYRQRLAVTLTKRALTTAHTRMTER